MFDWDYTADTSVLCFVAGSSTVIMAIIPWWIMWLKLKKLTVEHVEHVAQAPRS